MPKKIKIYLNLNIFQIDDKRGCEKMRNHFFTTPFQLYFINNLMLE